MTATALLELELDVRLRDVWTMIDAAGELDLYVVAAMVRAAYGQGYVDALSEPVRGQLCVEHGYPVPVRGVRARSSPA